MRNQPDPDDPPPADLADKVKEALNEEWERKHGGKK